jgi:hypothetical protein
MGYDAYAVAVIGVRLPPGAIKDKLFVPDKEPGCAHLLQADEKFCPECGAAAYIDVTKAIKEYEDGEGDGDKLCGYELVGRGEGCYNDPEFIAFWSSDCVRPGSTEFHSLGDFDLEDVYGQMQEKLEPLGLWNPEGFGLHVFLYESC